MKKQQAPISPTGDFLLYQTEDGRTRIEARFQDETVWLSLNQLIELLQRDKSVISKHIRNLFDEGEPQRKAVVANFATTAADGKTYQVDHCPVDLDFLEAIKQIEANIKIGKKPDA